MNLKHFGHFRHGRRRDTEHLVIQYRLIHGGNKFGGIGSMPPTTLGIFCVL